MSDKINIVIVGLGFGAGLRPPADGALPVVHHQGSLWSGRTTAPVLHPGSRPRLWIL